MYLCINDETVTGFRFHVSGIYVQHAEIISVLRVSGPGDR
ncbi:glutamate-1-semialdehyde aminotransferase [Chitinophagaceae bacterium OAS944]|nr:glutamate-1-semialdehyde aminotransferase [Chitinophagaceae bacterium OAS944]